MRLLEPTSIALVSSLAACVAQSEPAPPSAPPPAGPSKSEPPASAQPATPASYTDSQGTEIQFEAGDAAFADRVVSLDAGDPWTKLETEQDPEAALGPPSFVKPGDGTTVALGCGGRVTLEFTDNELVDRGGADLHVFEAGPQIEPFQVEISPDGQSWTDVGVVKGQPASVDIAESSEPGAVYRFVRLTDQRASCGSRWPGADIDAVGTLGGATR